MYSKYLWLILISFKLKEIIIFNFNLVIGNKILFYLRRFVFKILIIWRINLVFWKIKFNYYFLSFKNGFFCEYLNWKELFGESGLDFCVDFVL